MPLTTATQSVDSWVLTVTGLKLSSLLLGWARALPVVVIVPAFGLPRMPASLRSAIALAIAVAALPGAAQSELEPSFLLLTLATVDGFAIAVPAAVGMWVATMAGSLYDEFGGGYSASAGGMFSNERTTTGTLFGFIAVIVFLAQGGISRMATALSRPLGGAFSGFERLTQSLVSGIGLSVTLAAPLIIAQVLIELGGLLTTRANPAQAVRSLVVSVQGLLRLVVLALFLQWVFYAIAR